MRGDDAFLREHHRLTRRYFLQLGCAGAAGASLDIARADQEPAGATDAADPSAPEALAKAVSRLKYLTRAEKFTNVERGDPLPSELSPERRREVGLDRETWRLEVVPDADSSTKLEEPLSKERGNALDWNGLMRLAEYQGRSLPEDHDLQQHQFAVGHGPVGGRAAARRDRADATAR